MRRTAWLVVALAGCGPPVPKEVLTEISDNLAAVGHPFGKFQSVEIIDWKRGKPERHERYADIAVMYVRGLRPEPNTMVVRVFQESVAPCRISLDVLSDDGPDPFLLDNKTASGIIGRTLCRAMAED